MKPSGIRRVAAIVLFLAVVAGFAAAVWSFGYRAALDPLARRGQADLALAADRLTGELQRFRELAVLMADHPTLTALVDGKVPVPEAEVLLRQVADKTGSLDILLVDATGQELARAADEEGGAYTVSHAQTPYFERAMDGALGVYHLLSARYDRRAFVFAAPIFAPEGTVVGAVIVLTDVEEVEAGWRGDRPTVFFTDALGVIFVSNRSELLFRARSGDPATASLSAEYPAGRVTAFVGYHPRYVSGHEIWQVDGGPYVPARALHLTLDLPVVGMQGEALLDVSPARQLASLQAAVTAALCLAFGAMLFLATERRRTLAQANARLEARVADRTAELSALNTDLRREVAERIAAEARLTRAQADLVQAGKLSALGQMSAGISHELNQPLMAIRSFAENAEAFLERGRPEVAAQNLGRISELARRMGRIIRNLRAFARQESEPLTDVDLVPVVEAVLEMAGPKARQAETRLVWERPTAPVVVRGGEVRLQQVILNLVNNAIDAMAQSPERRVVIAILPGPRVTLSVRDTGPGLTEPERIFDPFYTTKAASEGEGMGLGLSISYGLVQSFGGAIWGRNHPEGGAIFTVELDPPQQGDDKAA
jgi:two-component system C4-dicarboxylate transport sensor histidine kinase DctB